MSVFQDLYDSEINFHIETMWDGGFEVKLGDDMNGYKAEKTFRRFGSVEPWLIHAACLHFPSSSFAQAYAEDDTSATAVRSIDRGQEIRAQVLYMAKDCARSPMAGDVIDAAETLAEYILNGKKPEPSIPKRGQWFASSNGVPYQVMDTPIDPPAAV